MPELPELELDENHIYRLDGVQLPGCTAVLSAMGATPGFNFLTPDDLEFYRSRGHAVHRAVELAVKGTLDKRTIVAEVNPYLIGWDRFCEDHKVEVVEVDGEPFVERQLYHSAYRYGVTPDVVAAVDGHDAVVEIKATSAHAPATGLQLSAQLLAVRQAVKLPKDVARIGLRLMPKEPYYDMKHYTERSDEAVWLSMLNTFNWLQRNKLLKENL